MSKRSLRRKMIVKRLEALAINMAKVEDNITLDKNFERGLDHLEKRYKHTTQLERIRDTRRKEKQAAEKAEAKALEAAIQETDVVEEVEENALQEEEASKTNPEPPSAA